MSAARPVPDCCAWLHHVLRLGESAFGDDVPTGRFGPTQTVRMLDQWDNVSDDPVMGQVERGYAGLSDTSR